MTLYPANFADSMDLTLDTNCYFLKIFSIFSTEAYLEECNSAVNTLSQECV